jgi:hypothetical protein
MQDSRYDFIIFSQLELQEFRAPSAFPTKGDIAEAAERSRVGRDQFDEFFLPEGNRFRSQQIEVIDNATQIHLFLSNSFWSYLYTRLSLTRFKTEWQFLFNRSNAPRLVLLKLETTPTVLPSEDRREGRCCRRIGHELQSIRGGSVSTWINPSTPHTLRYSTIVPWRLENPPFLPEWTIQKRDLRKS